MSIGRMDLNLLKVFDAVYEERNLVLAGKRLNLTQSAVSHALARLRELVGDELFMRTGKGMVPTGRATAMAATLRDSLRRIEATLGVEPFVPEASKRRFVIAANDHLTAVIIAPLSRELQQAAPGSDPCTDRAQGCCRPPHLQASGAAFVTAAPTRAMSELPGAPIPFRPSKGRMSLQRGRKNIPFARLHCAPPP